MDTGGLWMITGCRKDRRKRTWEVVLTYRLLSEKRGNCTPNNNNERMVDLPLFFFQEMFGLDIIDKVNTFIPSMWLMFVLNFL